MTCEGFAPRHGVRRPKKPETSISRLAFGAFVPRIRLAFCMLVVT